MNKELQKSIEKLADKRFELYSDDFEHETEREFAPHGDTHVCSGIYITDKSMKRCLDKYEEDFNVDDFIEELKDDESFCNAIRKIAFNHLYGVEDHSKWIGKFCWFWNDNPKAKMANVLIGLDEDSSYHFECCNGFYKNCRPIKIGELSFVNED